MALSEAEKAIMLQVSYLSAAAHSDDANTRIVAERAWGTLYREIPARLRDAARALYVGDAFRVAPDSG